MIPQIETYSDLKAAMTKIHEAHWESGIEAQSKMGWIVKDSISNAMKSKRTQWTTERKDGVRLIRKSGSHELGERIDFETGKKMSTPSMSNFIQWRTYSTTGTTVVGVPMKQGYTERRENGKVVKKIKAYGVGKQSVDIIEKMSTGSVGIALWLEEGGGRSPISMKRFIGTHRKQPANFIADGKNKALSGMRAKLNKWYKEAASRRDDINSTPMERL